MNEHTLESMVTHLVQCTCSSAIDCPKGKEKGLVQSKDLAFERPIGKPCEGKTSMTWNTILKDLLSRCPRFCRDEALNPPRRLVTARWRETNDRKVLAPLALKQNTDNIIAGNLDMSRKRKTDVAVWIPSKIVKVDGHVKPCSVVMRRASLKDLLLQYKCVNNSPYVRLYDVLKEIPQEQEVVKPVTQNEYMGFLGLDTKEPADQKLCPEVKTSHAVKLVSHPHIPFSSDYGRRLLARERHCLPQEVALRKIERTEWYLKGTAVVSKNHQPEIIYDKRSKYLHRYHFPKRQFSQQHQPLEQAFIKYVCKPLCVELEMVDLSPFVVKTVVQEEEMAPNISTVNGDVTSTSQTIMCNVNSTQVLTLNCAMSSENGFSDSGPRNCTISNNSNNEEHGSTSKVVVWEKEEHVSAVSNDVVSTERRKLRRSLRLNHTIT